MQYLYSDDRDHCGVANGLPSGRDLDALDQLSHGYEAIGSLGMSLFARESRAWR
jgi:hypothetical protein